LTNTIGMPALIIVAFGSADAGHVEFIDQVAGREHRAAVAFAFVGGIEEFQHDLGGREGHAVQFEVAGFLHLPSVIGTCATMVLPMLACQMRTVAMPLSRHAAGIDQPVAIANGPTAVD
jgi:hypothetical protein